MNIEPNTNTNKTAVICGANGFIGTSLTKLLKRKGYYVRFVDICQPTFNKYADEYEILDLRLPENCVKALHLNNGKLVDEVYQLAAHMGGIGYLKDAECNILHDNVLINTNMIHAATSLNIKRYFFSSSVCVYRDMPINTNAIPESEAYPAMPDNEYGWEKLFSERVALAYASHFNTAVRIGRFQNCYGPGNLWNGGKEKAPAALCRKIALAPQNGTIEIWGDGTVIRNFIFVDDLVDAIYATMHSDIRTPINIGTDEYVSVNDLAKIITKVSKKNITFSHIDGPVGVASRNFSNDTIKSLGWSPKYSLEEGIELTYEWICSEIKKKEGTVNEI